MVGLVAALADLVLPRDCAGCSRPGPAVCAACRESLAGPAFIADAGALAGLGALGSSAAVGGSAALGGSTPLDGSATTLSCVAAASYGGPTREVLLSYKERGREDAAAALGAGLAVAVAAVTHRAVTHRAAVTHRQELFGPVLLVPVPSSRASMRARGFDHVGRLASVAARDLRRGGHGVEVAPLLRVTRSVADQAGLGALDRAANLAGAFGARLTVDRAPRRWQARVVVVDDVVTTGATVAEAVRALRAAGFDVVGCAAVAATPVRIGGDSV